MNKQLSQKIYHLANFFQPVEPPDITQDMLAMKKRVMTYRVVFIFLGLLFTLLDAFLFFKTANWNFTFLFGYGLAAKLLISLFTFTLACASLWLGCHLRTEHELIKAYYKRAEQGLKRSFNRKRAPFHLKALLYSLEDANKEKNLRLFYEETLEEIFFACQDSDRQVDDLNHRTLPESEKRKEKRALLTSLKAHLESTLARFEQD